MLLKTDRIIATIEDVVMRSYNMDVDEQFVLDPTAIIGWTDGSDMRRDSSPRPTSNGNFAEPGTISARVITFSGIAVAKSRQGLQKLRDKLIGLLVDGEYKTLSVETSVGTRYATVGLEGTTSFVQQTDTFATFRISFYAPDPHIYGAPQVVNIGAKSATGGLRYPLRYPLRFNIEKAARQETTLSNSGNANAWPEVKVTGDYFSGFHISNNLGDFVTYSGQVTIQAPVTIDMARGTAIQGGVDKSALLTRRDWFCIKPNQTIRPTFLPIQSGTGWCDIIMRDTWI